MSHTIREAARERYAAAATKGGPPDGDRALRLPA
jgi:hypothetical protein